MTFQSSLFFFLFLPLCLLLYYAPHGRPHPVVPLLFSLVFYALNTGRSVLLIFGLIIADLLLGEGIRTAKPQSKRSRVLLILGVLLGAAVLIFYKYLSAAELFPAQLPKSAGLSVRLGFPLGLSFFVFKGISYLADLYAGRIDPGTEVTQSALYLSFFGQAQSGPVTRWQEMTPSGVWRENIPRGLFRFMAGFVKKTLLADTLGKVTAEVFFADAAEISAAYAWLGAVCWAMELYFDFSGYSDMAIGVTKMFGFSCAENFNYPYMTASAGEFWRRWHISLGAWFRDYVYIPLGGSRSKTTARNLLNLFAVWLLTGLWHGFTLNFIVWGLAYFLLIAFERSTGLPKRLRSRPARILYRVLLLTVIVSLWVIFRCSSLTQGMTFLSRMFLPHSADSMWNLRALRLFGDYRMMIIAGAVFCTPVVPMLGRKIKAHPAAARAASVAVPVVLWVLFLLSLSVIVSGQNNPFAYGNF